MPALPIVISSPLVESHPLLNNSIPLLSSNKYKVAPVIFIFVNVLLVILIFRHNIHYSRLSAVHNPQIFKRQARNGKTVDDFNQLACEG